MFKNLVTLVTGGASGLGRATVERFVKQGSDVIFCDLQTSNGVQVAKTIGKGAVYVPADVTSEKDVQNLVDVAKEKFGRIDAVVNCAGITTISLIYDPIRKKSNSLSEFENILNTNLLGTYNVIQHTLDILKANKPNDRGDRGVIVNTSGHLNFDHILGQSAFAAVSSAIAGLTQPLANELRSHSIRVVCVSPGHFSTPFISFIPEGMGESINENSALTPYRCGDPDEYAYLIQNIVENPLMNSTTVNIDAGLISSKYPDVSSGL